MHFMIIFVGVLTLFGVGVVCIGLAKVLKKLEDLEQLSQTQSFRPERKL